VDGQRRWPAGEAEVQRQMLHACVRKGVTKGDGDGGVRVQAAAGR
jgi:hypothetical protein